MISKEEFLETIEFIKEQRARENTFIEALELLSDNTYCDCFLYSKYEDKLVNLLESCLNDVNHDIGYFLYDCNGFEKVDKKRCPKVGNKYLYTSIETLYDYLVGNDQCRKDLL